MEKKKGTKPDPDWCKAAQKASEGFNPIGVSCTASSWEIHGNTIREKFFFVTIASGQKDIVVGYLCN